MRQFATFSPLSPAVKAGGKEAILRCLFSSAKTPIRASRGLGCCVAYPRGGGFSHLQTSSTLIVAFSGSQARQAFHC